MPPLFRASEPRGRIPDLEQQLSELDRQARAASSGYETQFLNRAGNLCVDAGQPKRALGYYGRAIDAYLESGRFSAAEVVCRKVLEIAPEAVRAHCTLAWLAIGKGYRRETERELHEYVRAARRAGNDTLAAKQLRMMGEAASSEELRNRIAAYLLELNDAAGADRVLGQIHAERNGLRPEPPADEGKLWAKLLRAALMGPQELKQQSGERSADELDEMGDALPSLRDEEN